MHKRKTSVSQESKTLTLKPPPSTGDVFADSCFVLEFPPSPDDRIGSQMEGLKDVPGLVKQGLLEDAWMILDTHHIGLKDLDFIYAFKALILQKNGQTDAAKKTLLAGLKLGRGKYLLYERLGFLFFETGQLNEAVKCWIKSIVAMKTLDKMTMWEPFLYLAGTAKTLSSEIHFRILSAWVREISPYGELSLDDKAVKKLNESAGGLSAESVLKALDILCRFYIPNQEAELRPAIPGIPTPGHPNVPATRDHLSAFKHLFGEDKRNAWVTRLAVTILALALILFFLQFLKTPEDEPDIKAPAALPEISRSTGPAEETKPVLPETQPPVAPVIHTKTPVVEMEQKKEGPNVESPEDPVP
ncbi:MAG: hypothetical protein WC836_21840, partial [Desulfobacula sp.]